MSSSKKELLEPVCQNKPVPIEPKETKPCFLSIDGSTYDVTKWLPYHPGGEEIIRKYNGYDATAVFEAFHSQEAYDKLKNFKAIEKKQLKEDKMMKNFAELTKKLVNAGLMRRNHYFYLYKTITTVGLCVLSFYLLFTGWPWYISAVLLGLFFQQSGWLGHEYCHHDVFENRKLNNTIGYFMGNFLQGFSSAWWKERHNCHHAITNVLDADPDIDNLPLFLWSMHDFERMRSWGATSKPMFFNSIPWQAYYFLPFCTTLRLIWCLQSWFFVSNMKRSGSKVYEKSADLEKTLLILHWVTYFVLVFLAIDSIAHMIYFVLVSQLLGGFCIAVVVFFNHYPMEHIPLSGYRTESGCDEPNQQMNFVELQLRTTRNGAPGLIFDWFCGGLNYQIEHHLYPSMPRNNLNKASFYVKEFCKENGLKYDCLGFVEGIKELHSHLNRIGREIQHSLSESEPTKKSS